MTTPLSRIRDYADEREEILKKILIKFMCRIGEECVKDARLKGSYMDQTGNLRSSIGYAVLCDGMPVTIAKPIPSGKGTESGQGVRDGEQYLKELAMQHRQKGFVTLIVAAGMKYAYYVEAIHNRVVLSSAEQLAPVLKNKILSELGLTL